MFVVYLLGALLYKGFQFIILGMEGGFKILFSGRDIILLSVQERLALRQASLLGDDIFPSHGDHILLPHKGLKLLAMLVAQLTTLVPQLLVHLVGGLALLLEHLPFLAVPILHLLNDCHHGLQERQVHGDSDRVICLFNPLV